MPTRFAYLLGFVTTSLLLLISLYLQFFDGFVPCPLCTLQRICFGILAILFFIGVFLHAKRWGRLFINSCAMLISILGMVLAGRQMWLQHFPTTDNSECGVGIQYMLQVLPLQEVMQKIFSGTAECTQRGWTFLALDMADWAFVWFALFLVLTIYLFLKERPSKSAYI